MTAFEKFLIEQGYRKFYYNVKKNELTPATAHHISTMVNLDHRYILDDNTTQIIFGLHEQHRPPTLIEPRPVGVVIQKNGQRQYTDRDDAMNVILKKVPHHQILAAMHDKTIRLKVDLRPNELAKNRCQLNTVQFTTNDGRNGF